MKKIAVIIASYNNRQWYERNLSTVVAQDYHDFRVIYVDDCSSDGTGELVEQFISDHNSGNLIHFIRNPIRLGALQNQYKAIHMCDDDEIVILLDGDDWFAHNGVLKKIDEVYANSACWMTYGQYRSWPDKDNMIGYSKEIPFEIIETNNFRDKEWCSSHLRSFYAWLFKLIKIEDLISPCGTFYNMASDQAIMFPMLEMSGYRAKFISEVLYIYNEANPINDCKVNRPLQRSLETVIRTQKPYDRLK
jgi:glycosyltransferase involved in cell wall biosynthesis